MKQAVFDPANMTATRLDDVFAIIPRRAHGYLLSKDGHLQNAIFVDMSNKPPGSGINSSAHDMGNFVVALYDHRLVSEATLKTMLNASKTTDGKPTIYGAGFFLGGPLGNYHGISEAGHGGDQQGFSSVLYLLPDKKFGVVALTNLEGQDVSLKLIELSRKIYDICSEQVTGYAAGRDFTARVANSLASRLHSRGTCAMEKSTLRASFGRSSSGNAGAGCGSCTRPSSA